MNFLSEVALDFPDAISFASGRPSEAYFNLDRWLEAIPCFQRYLAELDQSDPITSGRRLAQYGRTNGLINALVSTQIRLDHGVDCSQERIVVTSGCQEALALCLQTLCDNSNDVALARNPTYIGITGAAYLAGIPLFPLDEGADDDLAAALRRTALNIRAIGKRPRILYLVPDFDNPTGAVLSATERESIIAVASEFQIVVLEDNPYGMFRFEGLSQPSMFSLDTCGLVIYLGTYSKTLCPSVRVGFAAFPTTLFGDGEAMRTLVDDLSERKSFLTVNTSQLNQALVGGVLLHQQGSLRDLVNAPLAFYKFNRDVLLESLATAFDGREPRVTWNHPEGGFFLSVSLPFAFGKTQMIECARDYGLIAMPMSFFALDDAHLNSARFSFSNVSPEAIVHGVERFAAYTRNELARDQARR